MQTFPVLFTDKNRVMIATAGEKYGVRRKNMGLFEREISKNVKELCTGQKSMTLCWLLTGEMLC